MALTPEEIVRAVELADGWTVYSDVVRPPSSLANIGMSVHSQSQWIVDALATQLVRQLDNTLRHHHCYLRSFSDHTEIRAVVFARHEPDRICVEQYGTDRTENTILAILKLVERNRGLIERMVAA